MDDFTILKICLALKPLPAAAGDVILEEGTLGREMFFIVEGTCEVWKKDKQLDEHVTQTRTMHDEMDFDEFNMAVDRCSCRDKHPLPTHHCTGLISAHPFLSALVSTIREKGSPGSDCLMWLILLGSDRNPRPCLPCCGKPKSHKDGADAADAADTAAGGGGGAGAERGAGGEPLGTFLGLLTNGNFFGELVMITNDYVRRRTVIAKTDTELRVLSRDTVDELSREDSTLRKNLTTFALKRQRMEENLLQVEAAHEAVCG